MIFGVFGYVCWCYVVDVCRDVCGGCLICTLVMPTVIVVVLAVVVVWAGWSVTRVLLPVVVVVAGGSGLRRHPSKSRRNLGGFPHQV